MNQQSFEVTVEPQSLIAGKSVMAELKVTSLLPNECHDVVIEFNPSWQLVADKLGPVGHGQLSPGEHWVIPLHIESLPTTRGVLNLPLKLRWLEGNKASWIDAELQFFVGPPPEPVPPPPDERPKPVVLPMLKHNLYHDFEILIGDRQGSRYPVHVITSPAGQGEGEFSPPFTRDELSDLLERLEEGEIDETLLADFGTRLFAALFTGDVRARYAESMGLAFGDAGLRIRLRLAPRELQALPWELLRDPEKREALVLSKSALIVRYLPVPRATPPLVVEPPLRILVATASPTDCMPLDVVGELAAVEQALEPLSSQVQVMPLPHATKQALRQYLSDNDPHVLHFVGHGSFDGHEGALVLENECGRADRLPGTVLAMLLKGSSVRLAVLNACLSAIDATEVRTGDRQRAEMLGVGPALVSAGLGAVVGMQFSLPDASGVAFARDFYEMLARLYPVDACVSRAREALALKAGRDWAAPVLFMRAPDGVLFCERRSRT